MARSDPIADVSLPDMRARSRPGTAMAAMMPMIATTISSSMSVKPFWLRSFMTMSLLVVPLIFRTETLDSCGAVDSRRLVAGTSGGRRRPGEKQPGCHLAGLPSGNHISLCDRSTYLTPDGHVWLAGPYRDAVHRQSLSAA